MAIWQAKVEEEYMKQGNARPARREKPKSQLKDFTNEDDVKSSDSLTKDNSRIIKLQDDEKTPIYLLESHYSDGFAHWVPTASGDTVRVPCAGGVEGNGRAPHECPICAYVNDLYNRAQKSKGKLAEDLKHEAGRMRGSYEIYFVAAKGAINVVKIEGNKRKTAVEFDDPQVGLIRFTKAQYNELRGIPAKYDYIKTNRDIFNRFLIVDKRKRGDDEWASVEFQPAVKPTARPDVDIPEDIDLDGMFEIDMDRAKSALSLHLSDDDEESVDFEDDDAEDAKGGKVGARKTNQKSGTAGKGRKSRAVVDDEADDLDDEGGADEADESDDPELDDEDGDAVEADDSDESTDSDDTDEEAEVDLGEDESSDFDDGFLDDVDTDFEDDDPDEEEKPAVPKRGKKPAEPPRRPKAGSEPPRTRKPAPEPEKPRRGRPAKPAPAPVKTRRSAPVEEPKKRGRPASKPAPAAKKAPAKKGRR
jgi:hypothetical protein